MLHSLDNSYILDYVREHVRIKKSTGCWIFTGPRGGVSGYPTIMIDGKEYAVVALVLKAVGRLDDWISSPAWQHCHTCDNPRCVNEEHIFMGTPGDNVHDAINKGRHFSNRIAERPACANGHPFNTTNTWMYRGYRCCRACVRESIRRRRKIPLPRQIGSYIERRERLSVSPDEMLEAVKKYGNKHGAAKALGMSTWALYARWRAAGLPLDTRKQNRGRFRK